jgi:hypothetical protein
MRFSACLLALAVLCAAQSVSAQSDQRPNRHEILESQADALIFGTPLRWFGVVSGFVFFGGCDFELFPDERCFELKPDPAVTSWVASDITSITFPGNTFKTVICPVLVHTHNFALANNTASPQFDARFSVRTSITLESQVLLDPSAIDAGTGAPLNGKVEFPFGSRTVSRSLNPGERQSDSLQYSRDCQAGINRANLIGFGVPEALVDKLLREPMTLHLNMSGNVRMLQFGGLSVAMRVMGN